MNCTTLAAFVSLVTVGVLSVPASVSAVPITMDFTIAGSDTGAILVASPYVEDGFMLKSSTGVGFWGYSNTVYSYQANVDLIFSRVGGGSFDLFSLDLLQGLFNFSTPPSTITGNLIGGGTVSHAVTGLGTQTFSGFVGLSSVVWYEGLGTRVDNIVADGSVSAVPEPATLTLMSVGLAGLVSRRRKLR